MKKRSLVAALAMLMVSAIVLTSSTYAWFATASQAQVGQFTADITNDSSSIGISTTSTGVYGISISEEDLKLVTANYMPGSYNPVSMSFATNGTPTVIGGSITTDEDTQQLIFNASVDASTSTTNANYTKYQVFVRASESCTVNVTPTMQAQKDFFYAAITDGASYKVYTAQTGGRNYTPVNAAVNGIDDGNYYMTGADKLSNGTDAYNALGTQVQAVEANATNAFALTFDAADAADDGYIYKSITVYCWAEGNDSACSGAVNGAELTFSLGFEVAE